jgi:hypothetical protein
VKCKAIVFGVFARSVLIACVFCGVVSSAHADTAYAYVGNPFTNFAGTAQCPPQCATVGFFVVAAPLPPNLIGDGSQFEFDVNPIAYAFTDGATVATKFNSCYDFFSIGTDSSGDIDSFTIRLFAPVAQAPCSSSPGIYGGVQLLISGVIDISIQAPAAVNFAAIPDSPGKWTTINLAEPTTFDLLLFGVPLLGLVCGYNRLKTNKFAAERLR